VVELGVRVTDPIRRQALVERASQVFRQPERVIARAMDLRRHGQVSERPLAAAIQSQNAVETQQEKDLLQALLMSPEELPYAQREIDPTDFRDQVCGQLATLLWGGKAALEAPSVAGALARDLVASGGISAEGARWNVAARAHTQGLVIRGLSEQRKQLLRGPTSPESVAEIERIEQAIEARRQLIRDLEKQERIEGKDPMPDILAMVARYMRKDTSEQERK
jgi:hypothetical protein